MCTSAAYITDAGLFFGRNLDYEKSFGESVVFVPRAFLPRSLDEGHYAFLGTAHVKNGYPLFYDGVNEKGLCMAGLNLVHSTSYSVGGAKKRVPQYDVIQYFLGKCASVDEFFDEMRRVDITDDSFDDETPPARLHWMIADKNKCAVLECVNGETKIYDDPVRVLTNEPPFPYQLTSLSRYSSLSPRDAESTFSTYFHPPVISRGNGSMGLPGDYSSQSRFVRAAFVLMNSPSDSDAQEIEGVTQLFHVLSSAEQPKGSCILGQNGETECEYTIYSSCMDALRGVYYLKTYDSLAVSSIDMHGFDPNSDKIVSVGHRELIKK